ncbi:MAG: hypothetical protein JSV98_03385 [candidate division WOR-3 bacterium]|nr:MAG: hypothetical protein JSV98_03385 [candidate division WOR-3 bacterium]
MKAIMLLLLTFSLCLFAEETYLGIVHGIEGDSLILVDGLRVYVPNARGSLVYKNVSTDAQNISFPFRASLVRDRTSRAGARTYVRIERLYEIREGKLIAKE